MKFKSLSFASIFITSLFAIFSLKGQDTTRATKISSVRCIQVSYSPGYFRSTNSSFNKILKKEGYNSLSSDMFNEAIAIDFSLGKRFMLTAKAQHFRTPGPKEQPNNYESTLNGYGLIMGLGYVLIKKEHFRLHVYCGEGFSIATFRIKIRDAGHYPYSKNSNLLTTPSRDLKYPLPTAIVFEGGIGFEKIMDLKSNLCCPQKTRYLSLGVKVGYFTSGSSPLGGVYANLLVAMGTKIKRVRWI